uniref:NHR domain-containing protein n=1 Tax=Nothobranchius kadleci TaxID=1051664 RepID=A0A1A8C8P4_NOTKA
MPAMPHMCDVTCLGPLTFHSRAGDRIQLSEGDRRAERIGDTFRDGLVFSSRPVRVNERIRVCVQKHACKWKGALRVGFTNLSPSARTLPLPPMAIPNLTSVHGHWAAVVPEAFSPVGSELQFWVSNSGKLFWEGHNTGCHKLLSGVDLSKPLWAVIDLYGQTCSIFLLGSEKKDWVFTRRSCPAPAPLIEPPPSFNPDFLSPCENREDVVSSPNREIPAGSSCVACMVKEPTVTLRCGHRCLCSPCTLKVRQHIGSCPLCRQQI